ncbi:Hypothetical predicted protein [Olea europaea subsp. europaea]|uniref:Retrovirus-related Pol polyprotein from transposon TNT 1-94-like beta-barrel domain-containing protein n=1 Tax=Olea europaea subsp. europaea TaxID=158383 RepID=A0A8S0UTD3_OLEEU|nr:Hypothetical predicted protein [Olea europaea subsp. europaea]
MSFLMGLHDSFSQIRGQILLMDPLPPVNKVFALVSQEENQRKIRTSSIGADSNRGAAFAFKADNGRGTQNSGSYNDGIRVNNKKKERAYCTHCKYHGHSIDKCYKIHGFPPGFKSKRRDNFQNFLKSNAVNQISVNSQIEEKPIHQQVGLEKFMQNLNSNQYQYLMTMLSTHLASNSQPTPNDLDKNDSTYTAGIYHSAIIPTFSCKNIWIVDSGASRHVCSIAAAFIKLRPITNSHVTLPNHTQISVVYVVMSD